MRNTFVTHLMEHAKKDRNTLLITGDLGYSVLEVFQNALPQQFINAGIAEQNMTGLAAGLALCGKKVFTYSIANFPTIRCLEQIRNDICYHNADVKIIAVGSGFSYGTQGYTHHGIEDIAMLRTLPHMTVYSPACPEETSWCLKQMLTHQGPAYMRLAKQGEPILHQQLDTHTNSHIFPLLTGYKDTLLTTGVLSQHIYHWVKKNNIPLNVYTVPVIKPLDLKSLLTIAKLSVNLFTVEEHQLHGGFGSAILESLHDLQSEGLLQKLPLIHRLGIQDEIMSDMTTEIFATKIIQRLSKNYLAIEA